MAIMVSFLSVRAGLFGERTFVIVSIQQMDQEKRMAVKYCKYQM